ncbi:MAG: hypothetical protein OCD01_04765 [Fibrobacterales bacterium]
MIYENTDVVTGVWHDELKVIEDVWVSSEITFEGFLNAIVDQGLSFAKRNGGLGWIVNMPIESCMGLKVIAEVFYGTIFDDFKNAGIKSCIFIFPKKNSITEPVVSSYNIITDPCGLKIIEVDNYETALERCKYI